MELALRRAWGYAFAPSLNYQPGMQGLGDDTLYSDLIAAGVDPTDAAAYQTTPASDTTLYDQLIAQGVNPTDAAAYLTVAPLTSVLPTTLTPSGTVPTVSSPVGTTLSPTLCSDGSAPFSDGSCTQTAAPAGSQGNIAALAQVAAALTKAVAPTVSAVGGIPTCPAGFVYGAPGASVSISPGVSTVGTGKCLPSTTTTGLGASLIAGLSNTTLLVGVLVFAAVMMATGSKRR